ncbi:MAG: lysophospholipid acyltransferase family protein [Synergistaceae bacterium]|nr:lysophospholipid acyltransferase family protein [Synergistaceae bacterium]
MALKIFVKLLRFMPHRAALVFGGIIGRILRLVLWRKVDRAEARCVLSLGVGVSIAREIVRGSFVNLGMSAVEFLRFPVMKARVDEYIDFPEESQALLRSALARGKGVILMTSHMANWELAAMRVIHAGFELHAVYTPQRNDGGVESMIADIRTRTTGMHIIDNHKGIREIFRVLKSGGIVVIMQDLDARKDGVITKFLGLPASTHDGIVKLHEKFGCAVVATHYTRDKDNPAHHVVEMQEILSDRENFGLELCSEVIEKWIRERPELWLWLMDRWEYTLGKKR